MPEGCSGFHKRRGCCCAEVGSFLQCLRSCGCVSLLSAYYCLSSSVCLEVHLKRGQACGTSENLPRTGTEAGKHKRKLLRRCYTLTNNTGQLTDEWESPMGIQDRSERVKLKAGLFSKIFVVGTIAGLLMIIMFEVGSEKYFVFRVVEFRQQPIDSDAAAAAW